MGLFGKLFDKEACGTCNGEVGALGKRKLEDGVICKECARKLSPFFSDRRRSTLHDIRDQLAYRESNQDRVARFNVTRTLGDSTKVLLDEDASTFMVTSQKRWREANPDVMEFSQVTGCDSEVRESKTEIRRELPDGTKASYSPPRYDIDYDVFLRIHVNSPYFDKIEFRVNDYRIDKRGSIEFREAERRAAEIREALTQVRHETREQVKEANAPKTAMTCPLCGATTIPDASGRCAYCGGATGA